MNKSSFTHRVQLAAIGGLGTCLFAGPLLAADAVAAAGAGDLAEVVITGFRESLRSSIDTKRNSSEIIDVVKAEDIGKFPDLNLAESLQRIPGVAIDRDGGEGRSITVRGLGPDFTRVRLNGMEALATTGGTDSSGGANRGRGFDFQIFAAELFSSLEVRKSAAASVEEGSLGATVDLRTARPFDYGGPVFAISGEIGYNDLSEKHDPRATLMLSNRFFDDKFGALVSVAYSDRTTIDEGSSTGRWESGVTVIGQASTGGLFRGRTATDPVSLAFHPRIPRYGRLVYDQKRLGVTTSLQFQAAPGTLLNLDALYAKQDGSRSEQYLEIISFSRAGQGNPQTTIINPGIAPSGDIMFATFNGVDARTEDRIDKYTNKFSQLALTLEQDLGDRTKLKALFGRSRSSSDNPIQTTVTLDRYDSNGYAYDYSGNNRLPAFNYGFDVTNPANWQFSASTALGDASLIRMRPNTTDNDFDNVTTDLSFQMTDALALNGGLSWKKYDFNTTEQRRFSSAEAAVPLPPGATTAQISTLLTGFGNGLNIPSPTPTTWLRPSIDAVAGLLDIYCNCINQYGDFRLSSDNIRGNNRVISETDKAAYLQLDFRTHVGDMPLRGNVGVRYVKTDESAQGYVGTGYATVDQDYSDVLPSANVTLEVRPNVLARLAAAKVMARPQLQNLTPGGTLSTQAATLTIGNPLLEPFRANTVDLNFEWYPDKDTLLSAGFFYKDIKTFIQTLITALPYGETGLPPSFLPPNQTPATIYTVTQPVNTEGGPLKGLELSVQRPFTFLPGFWSHFGGIANYTRVSSEISYVLTTSATAGTTYTTADLVNLSPTSWNLVLYWENDKFSARVSEAFRDRYLSTVPGGSGNDMRGKESTRNIDFQMTYNFTKQLSATFQGINLTDQVDDRWISSTRNSSESYDHFGRQYYLGMAYKR